MRNYAKAPRDIVDKAKDLSSVAKEFKIPLAAAALQFPQANKLVSSVIPGPRSKEEFLEIIRWQKLEIPSKFWEVLKDRGLLRRDAPTP